MRTLTQKQREMKSRLLHVNGRIMTLSALVTYEPRYKSEIEKLMIERRRLTSNMPTMTACIS